MPNVRRSLAHLQHPHRPLTIQLAPAVMTDSPSALTGQAEQEQRTGERRVGIRMVANPAVIARQPRGDVLALPDPPVDVGVGEVMPKVIGPRRGVATQARKPGLDPRFG